VPMVGDCFPRGVSPGSKPLKTYFPIKRQVTHRGHSTNPTLVQASNILAFANLHPPVLVGVVAASAKHVGALGGEGGLDVFHFY